MRDPELETQLRLTGLQVENWTRLHDFFTYALDKQKPIISAHQERQFTETRSILLQETEHILGKLDLLAELSPKAMNVLRRASSMRTVREFSLEEARRLESDWNVVFTKLGIVQGQLKAQRKELLSRTPFSQSLASIFLRHRRLRPKATAA